MKIIKPVLIALSLLCANLIYAQTAEEIVAKHVDAMGGKDKLSQIKSVYTEGSTEVMGNGAETKTYLLSGKGFKSEMDFNGQKIIQCFTEKGGWAVNPFGGDAAPQAMPAEQYNYGKNQMYAGGVLFDYAAKGNKIELLGKEGNDYKLKVTTASKAEMTYYIDGTTYYITKSTSKSNFQGQDVTVTLSYSNYKKTDFGNVMPYTLQTDLGQFSLAQTVTKIDINKDINPSVFEQGK